MSMTAAQRRKIAKRKARERRIRKMANMRNNRPYLFAVDIEMDDKWVPEVMKFKTWKGVGEYCGLIEQRRAKGEEIAPSRVRHLGSGEIVLEIRGSKDKDGVPDKIVDGAKADPCVRAAERV